MSYEILTKQGGQATEASIGCQLALALGVLTAYTGLCD